MNNLPIGARFQVYEPVVFEDAGVVVASYKPRLNPYVVTERNVQFVSRLVLQGKAAIVGWNPLRGFRGTILVE